MNNTEKMIDKLFTQMECWRHLPSYQLERRADLFFSLFLKDIIKHKFDFEVKDCFIPEFPIRKGLLFEEIENDKSNRNRSFKVDYVAVSEDLKKAILVELKTEPKSKNPKQDAYLEKARKKGFSFLLQGVTQLYNQKNSSKKKYLCLLKMLESIGQINLDPKVKELSAVDAITFTRDNPSSIKVLNTVTETFLLYIQPSNNNFEDDKYTKFVTFGFLIGFIKENADDALSRRFANSLVEWEKSIAGDMSSVTDSEKNINFQPNLL